MKPRAPLFAVIAIFLASPAARADLLGYWSADDGAGQTLTNNAGDAALDGVLDAAAGWTADGGGHSGQAGDFALDLSGIATSTARVSGLDTLLSEVTISAWINPDAVPPAWTGIFGSRSGGVNQLGFGFRNNTGNLVYTWNGNSNTTYDWDSALNVPLNQWSFVALTITSSGATVYLGTAAGGLVSATNAIPHAAESGGQWSMGIDDCCGGSRNLDGQLDDIAIWDQALDAGQIANLFNGTSPLAVLNPELGGIVLQPALPNPLGPEPLHVLASAPVGTRVGSLLASDAAGVLIPSDGVSFSIIGGVGDAERFSVGGGSGDQLLTAADLSAGGATTYSVRVRAEDLEGGSVEVDLSVRTGADSDADALLDGWEERFAPGNLALLSGATDHEPDGLTSGDEFLLGTDPTDPDGDGDGLLDGDEVAAGTDPSDPDSDGDTLSDGDEVHGSPPTNPLRADTDGDGFSDAEELAAGTDPTDPGDAPQRLIGYWPANEGTGTLLANAAGDAALDGLLQNGAWGVGKSNTAGDFAVDLSGGAGSTVSVPATGETFGQITITAWVNGVPTGDFTGLVQARLGGQPPIGLGFRAATGELTYTWNNNAAETFNFTSGLVVPPNQWAFVALVIRPDGATLYVGPAGDGAALSSATNAIAHLAQPNTDVSWNFGIDNCCEDTRNFDGLMDEISIWNGALTPAQIESLWSGAASPLTILNPGQGFRITAFGFDEPGGSGTITWASVPGRLYSVDTSTDLSNWIEVEDSIAATGTSTTFPLDLPAGEPRVYVRVRLP